MRCRGLSIDFTWRPKRSPISWYDLLGTYRRSNYGGFSLPGALCSKALWTPAPWPFLAGGEVVVVPSTVVVALGRRKGMLAEVTI
jgi:hypothetical protein